jgi:PKD repeat protein
MPNITGAFLAGGDLYTVSRSSGDLSKVAFTGGTPTGAYTVVSGPGTDGIDWRSRALFFGSGAPANVPPTAAATSSCTELVCSFNAAGSTDSDGTIASYAWTFGDNTTGTGVSPSHTYTAAGTYPVVLTVTDDKGATATTSLSVSPAPLPVSPIAFRATASVNKVSAVPAVTVPSAVQAGDELLLIATSSTATSQAAPAGWTSRGTANSSGVLTTVWEKTASGSDAGSSVTVTLNASTKVDVHLLAYSGAGPLSAVQTAIAGAGTVHTAPSATVATAGSWVIRYWADKSSTTTGWTLPGSVTSRDTVYGTGSGFISTAIGDSGGPVAAGPSGTSVANTNVSSSRDVTATIVLPPD